MIEWGYLQDAVMNICRSEVCYVFDLTVESKNLNEYIEQKECASEQVFAEYMGWA